MSALGRALLEDLDPGDLDGLADALAPILERRFVSVLNPVGPSKLLNVAQAADQATCHPETIRRAIRAGALTASLVGRNWRIATPDLEAWLTVEGHPVDRTVTQRRASGRQLRPLTAAIATLR